MGLLQRKRQTQRYNFWLAAMEEKKLEHIGIVMDGNRRWAKKRGLPTLMGHHAGVKALEKTLRAAKDFGIKYLSVYAFSTENWNRSNDEVSGLMGLFKLYAKLKLRELIKENARVRFAGVITELPSEIISVLCNMEEKTAGNDTIQMIVCLNYGGRREITDAVNRLIKSGVSEVTEDDLSRAMYLPDLPYPDLLIRTSGEFRMSNFWLWEGAYSEYYFTDTLWPDFGKDELKKAIDEYYGRSRRYGC